MPCVNVTHDELDCMIAGLHPDKYCPNCTQIVADNIRRQVAEDTCVTHHVFCCNQCFDMSVVH